MLLDGDGNLQCGLAVPYEIDVVRRAAASSSDRAAFIDRVIGSCEGGMNGDMSDSVSSPLIPSPESRIRSALVS
jgi:hypothetical protein